MPARLIVFISGNGTNLQAILDAIQAGDLDAQVALVVSNRKAAYGLVRAAQAGIPSLYFPLKPYAELGREAYDRDLASRIAPYNPRLIVLAGWMHVLSPAFLDQFPRQVINLHPALPGQFPGTDAIERTFEAHQRGEVTGGGIMVHYVIPEVDAGSVIAQESVPITEGDSLETFEAHIHAAEHRLLIDAIRLVIQPEV
ncbi:MAG TPA: phosphoribosylglycinamide formyltransferase [Phototrophicaceae bacterium]|nr:phosphoribosylglycinamide formyltransferase [Phototrophicaceae bacterium]